MNIETFQLGENEGTPNNERFALLVYHSAFNVPTDPRRVEKHLESHRWYNAWRNGVFPYHHYHATVHEILVCFSGGARVQFGGESGPEMAFSAGDAVLIPAGVGHKRIQADPSFAVIGAYLDGASWDLRRPEADDADEAKTLIKACGKPPVDPITGSNGGLIDLWPGK